MARKPFNGTVANNVMTYGTGAINIDSCRVPAADPSPEGRFPANFIHGGIDEEWSRYFYCPKANKKDRGAGNDHPTVKPFELMRYLCRLVTQPGGVVLDPFMGSGSTGRAALHEGFRFIGIEREEHYFDIAVDRINNL